MEPRLMGPGSLRRQGVPALDRLQDPVPALACRQLLLLFDGAGLGRELGVLDRPLEPGRVVALPEMVVPGAVVDPPGDLDEGREVLGAQVELAVRPPEPEALVGSELPLRVLPPVALPLGAWRRDGDHLDRTASPLPQQDLPRP